MPVAGLDMLIGLINAKVARRSAVRTLIANSSTIYPEFWLKDQKDST